MHELFVRACVRLQGVSNGTSFAPLPTRLSFLHVRQDESSSLTVCFLKLLVLKFLNKCRQTRAGYKSKQHLHTVMQSSANCAKNTAFVKRRLQGVLVVLQKKQRLQSLYKWFPSGFLDCYASTSQLSLSLLWVGFD